jgi:hypothetical protein
MVALDILFLLAANFRRHSPGDWCFFTEADSTRNRATRGTKTRLCTGTAKHRCHTLPFDLGGVLDCRRFKDNGDDLWTLYKPRGYMLSVCGNGTLNHLRGIGVELPQAIERAALDDGRL